jgi:F0F1-type ATP synthase membrane subunit c/vacuolar-type H+-ATPase subunit K
MKSRNADAVTATRMIWIGLVLALFSYAFVLSFIIERSRWFATDGTGHPWMVVGLTGLVSVALVRWISTRPLDVRDQRALAKSYRSSLFMGIGFGEAPALIAFVLTFVTHTLWVYLLGLGFSLIGLTLIAPSPRNIRRRQDQITASGSPLSLGAALLEPPAKPERSNS